MTTTYAMQHAMSPTTTSRLRFHAAWMTATAVFMSVGWIAMQSSDPRGPVSLLANGHPGLMMIEVLALAVVTSAVATVFAGRVYADAGVFAVGIGLTAVALRGHTSTYFLIQQGATPGLCLTLLAESVFWFAAIIVAMITAAAVVRWLGDPDSPDQPETLGGHDHSGRHPHRDRTHPVPVLAYMAAPALPIVGRLFIASAGPPPCDRRHTVKHIAVAVVVALVLIRVFSAGATDRPILHGQACFAIAAGFYFAVRRAQAMFPLTASWGSCCAVPLTCVIAFLFAAIMAGRTDAAHLPSIPPSTFLRTLPVTYVALGTAAALFARWQSLHDPSPR